MKLTYVCTNYNNTHYTLAAVESLAKNINHDIRVFVVDNASKQEELVKLNNVAETYPFVRVIANSQNVGYFAGLNIGIAAARRDDPQSDWMVVGNNDLEFPEDFCEKLDQKKMEFRSKSVVSPDVATLDGEHQNPHVITGISTIREIFYDIYYSNYWLGMFIYKAAKLFPRVTRRGDELHWKKSQYINQGHGSCYLLTPRFFSQFDSLWAPTFMMSEEAFLSIQLERVGEQVFYSPDISVTHHWHGSLRDVPSRNRWNMARDAHKEYRKYIKVFKGVAL